MDTVSPRGHGLRFIQVEVKPQNNVMNLELTTK
jgi:hypothetical protein